MSLAPSSASLGERMFIPFQDEINDLFESDQSIWDKLKGGAFVGVVVAAQKLPDDPIELLLRMLFAGCLASVVVVLLSLRDVVWKRMLAGQRVSLVLRLYLAHGVMSIALGAVTFIVFAFFGAVLLLSLVGL
jgi:hypothetical protein